MHTRKLPQPTSLFSSPTVSSPRVLSSSHVPRCLPPSSPPRFSPPRLLSSPPMHPQLVSSTRTPRLPGRKSPGRLRMRRVRFASRRGSLMEEELSSAAASGRHGSRHYRRSLQRCPVALSSVLHPLVIVTAPNTPSPDQRHRLRQVGLEGGVQGGHGSRLTHGWSRQRQHDHLSPGRTRAVGHWTRRQGAVRHEQE